MKTIAGIARMVILCLMAFVDLLTISPIGSLIAFFRKRVTAAFIAHPGTINEVQKWWTFVGEIKPGTKKEHFWEWVLRNLWPVSGQRIVFQNGKKNVVRIIYLSLTAKLMRQYPKKAEKQSIRAARLAERIGANFIGLGGQVPGNCQYGFTLKPGLKKANLTTGHAYSLSMVYAHTLLFSHEIGIDFSQATIAIVGAGSMGRGMALLLSKNNQIERLIVIDRNENLLCDLVDEVQRVSGVLVETSTDLNQLTQADVIVSVANSDAPIIMPEHIKSNFARQWDKVLIIEDGYPPCVSPDILKKCDNVVMVAGGATKTSVVRSREIGFGFLPGGYTVSCFAELLILILLGWKSDYTLGKVDIGLIDRIYSEGIEMGFYPGCLSNEKRMSKACQREVEPRQMLIKLVNHQKSDSSSILFQEREIELAKA